MSLYSSDEFLYADLNDCCCPIGVEQHDIGCPPQHDIGCPKWFGSVDCESKRTARRTSQALKKQALQDLARRHAGATIPNLYHPERLVIPSNIAFDAGVAPLRGGTLFRSPEVRVLPNGQSAVSWAPMIPVRGPYRLDIEFTEQGPEHPDREHLLASFSVERFQFGNQCLFASGGALPARQVFDALYAGDSAGPDRLFHLALQTGHYGFSYYLVIKSEAEPRSAFEKQPRIDHPPSLPTFESSPGSSVPPLALPEPLLFPPLPSIPCIGRAVPPDDPKHVEHVEHDRRARMDRNMTANYLAREDPFADIDPDDP